MRLSVRGQGSHLSKPAGRAYDSTLAELAFVIAHEIGHVAARHATREATRGQLIQLSSVPAMIFDGWTGVAVRQLAGHGSQLGMAKSSRVFETQADHLGIEFLEAAGYDSSAATDVFERIEASERKQPGAVERLYSSHPVTPARIEQVQKELESLKSNRTDWVINTSEYEEKRRRVVEIERRREAAEQAHKPTLVH
jgi:beta-barrel assembly-enhancing protease